MDVDRHNFTKIYDLIVDKGLVEKCDAVSIDLEFTGLRFDNNDKERYEDYLFDRYDKMRSVVRKYSIIQVGLTFFLKTEGTLTAYPFNFYVYPRAYKNVNPIVSMQSSTIQFNTKNGMDWNKWIRDGITYLQLDKISQALQQPQKTSTLEDLEQKLTEQQSAEVLLAKKKLQDLSSDEKRIEETIEVSSTFVRLVVQRIIDKHFPMMYLEPFGCDSPLKEKLLLCIRKVNMKDRENIQKQLSLSIVGFTSIFEMIWKRKIRVIGHNSFFDLMYIYNSFVTELPTSYIKFKEQISNGLPKYYDTKLLSSRKEFAGLFDQGTSLEELQKAILSEKYKDKFPLVKVDLAPDFTGYDWRNPDNRTRLHEAGYDSYLTGWIFYQLSAHIADLNKLEAKVPVLRSIWDINLNQNRDDYAEQTLVLVIVINKPKEFIQNLFEYKRKKINQVMETLNLLFSRGKYAKDQVRIRQYKVDYVFVDLRSPFRKREFISDMFSLKEQGYDIRTMGTFIKDRIEMLDQKK